MNGSPKHLSNNCNNYRNDLGKSIYTNIPDAKFSKFPKSIYTNVPELISNNLTEIMCLLYFTAPQAPQKNFTLVFETSRHVSHIFD